MCQSKTLMCNILSQPLYYVRNLSKTYMEGSHTSINILVSCLASYFVL